MFGKAKNRYSSSNLTSFVGDKLNFEGREAYKLLRTNVFFSLPKDDSGMGKIIGITSSFAGEYKSTTALNLAISIADSGLKVLLVDCDMRLSHMAETLKLGNKIGLSDYLAGQETNILRKGILKRNNLDLILAGYVPPNPAELLGSEKMKKFIQTLAGHYDYIILDLPPVNAVTDASIAAQYADGVLVVVRQNVADKKTLKKSVRQLEYTKCRILGFVYTGVQSGDGRYYKKYGKGYGYYAASDK